MACPGGGLYSVSKIDVPKRTQNGFIVGQDTNINFIWIHVIHFEEIVYLILMVLFRYSQIIKKFLTVVHHSR